MSRSHKKPVVKQKNNQFYKKWFNKKLRRNKSSFQGMNYKKANCTWDICDFNTGELAKNEINEYGKDKYKVTMK